MNSVWPSRYALRTQGVSGSIIREILKFTQRPEVISFAGGLPAAEYFPVERFQEACQRVLANQAHMALQYSTTEGYPPLRELIAERLRRESINVSADNVLITTGSQQALSLLGALLINPGDRVLVEEPTYLGALQAFSMFQAQYVSVRGDDNGICADEVPAALRSGPKFMYILPNFQNPAGVTISADRRAALVRLAEETGIPIVEDDPYGALRFEGEHLASLMAVDAARLRAAGVDADAPYEGNVLYLGTFSKTLAPGLRAAWAIGPHDVVARLAQLKQGADLHSSTFDQMVTYEVAKDGFLDQHIQQLREVYRHRRDVMLGALDRYAPPELNWTQPQGGLFLWMRLPEGVSEMTLFNEAVKRNVAFVPGNGFYTRPDSPPSARLNFSCMPDAQIEEGIRRLCDAIKDVRS